MFHRVVCVAVTFVVGVERLDVHAVVVDERFIRFEARPESVRIFDERRQPLACDAFGRVTGYIQRFRLHNLCV